MSCGFANFGMRNLTAPRCLRIPYIVNKVNQTEQEDSRTDRTWVDMDRIPGHHICKKGS